MARLSGGERNRLLLARLFTKPSNVLVMDEPTNDLDVETLELLEELLMEYPGTLLLVSHDREFLNNVVTSTLVLEGDGRVKEYAGGYDDWLRQSAATRPPPEKGTGTSGTRSQSASSARHPSAAGKGDRHLGDSEPVPFSARHPPRAPRPRRLNYKEQRELESLPERIATLEAELSQSHEAMADPSLYRRAPSEIVEAKARLQSLEQGIAEAYKRWEELETLREQVD